jgi:DNA-binding LacI/PurR family transcriptional regulator
MGKREQLREYILNEIRFGRLKAMDKIPSRTVFMDKFQCARATVDQVVSGLVGSKILVSEKGRGTYVAESGVRKKGKKISLAAPVLDHPSFSQRIIHGFLEHLGAQCEVLFFTYDELKQPQSWHDCRDQRGVVFIQPDVQQNSLLHEVRSASVPHLVLYRDPPESPFVSIDNRGGIAALVDALQAKGCRRIAYAGARPGRYHAPEQRYSGYLEGLLRNGLPLDKAIVGLFNPGAEKSFLRELFRLPQKPDAVIAAELQSGLVIKAAADVGLAVGRDVLLGQLDEVPPNTYSFKTLSLQSITGEIGRQGAEEFLRMLETPERSVQKYVTPGVVEQ